MLFEQLSSVIQRGDLAGVPANIIIPLQTTG